MGADLPGNNAGAAQIRATSLTGKLRSRGCRWSRLWEPEPGRPGRRATIDIVNASLGRRYRAERRFRLIGMSAVVIGLALVAVLFADIIGKGYSAFQQTYIRLAVDFSAEVAASVRR